MCDLVILARHSYFVHSHRPSRPARTPAQSAVHAFHTRVYFREKVERPRYSRDYLDLDHVRVTTKFFN